jgi:DNA invertase Pin-like site-specific DNA recombinase
MNHLKLTPDRLLRAAVVYVRQSTPTQVTHHLESQRRQYALEDRARGLGFQRITMIDEDLGRTGSGLVDRPGFQRLVAEVCTGEVGAVFCIEASRLARNGRDWHHLIELCGMVGAVVVDMDGVYDPNLINDRLVLGLKGTMSEFEATLIRRRSIEAIHQKARRGELWIPVPVGFGWTPNGKIQKHPDQRVQQAIQLVIDKMTELGSMRQVLIWLRQNNVCLPVAANDDGEYTIIWKLPQYQNIQAILTNPTYAGAYAFGKTETRTKVVDGRARKRSGYRRPRSQWTILIPDHHPGYLSWEEYERNQLMIAANTHMRSGIEPKAGRGGRALLSGLLRCRRCGRMLYVTYSGPHATVIRYECRGERLDCGEGRCISFGGLRVDARVGNELLHAIEGNAIEAAVEAAERMRLQRQELRRSIELEIEQARYEARLAARRYEAVDPEQRLVAAELEARWNTALQKVQELDDKLRGFDSASQSVAIPDRQTLISLAQDMPAIWNSPTADMRLKQRIARILIREIVTDVDENNREIILLIHWAGGRHSELRLKKSETGKHRHCTNLDAIDVITKMAGKFSDEEIAATLNRLRLRTGADNTWNENRVYSVRHRLQLPIFDPNQRNPSEVTLKEAAHRLNLSPPSVRRLIKDKLLPAHQVVECAPWQIPVAALESEIVNSEALRLRNRIRVPRTVFCDDQQSMFSES